MGHHTEQDRDSYSNLTEQDRVNQGLFRKQDVVTLANETLDKLTNYKLGLSWAKLRANWD